MLISMSMLNVTNTLAGTAVATRKSVVETFLSAQLSV